jgi:hypothetical protein
MPHVGFESTRPVIEQAKTYLLTYLPYSSSSIIYIRFFFFALISVRITIITYSPVSFTTVSYVQTT